MKVEVGNVSGGRADRGSAGLAGVCRCADGFRETTTWIKDDIEYMSMYLL